MDKQFSSEGSDFAFAVPMLPRPSKPPTTGVGLNILAEDEEVENFIPSDSFADAVNANDWDTLLAHSTGRPAACRGTRWERESLYQQFDPLVRNSPMRQMNKQVIKEHGQMSQDLLNAEVAVNNVHGNENLNLTFQNCASNEELHLERQRTETEVQLEHEEVKMQIRRVETEAQLDDEEVKMHVEENMGTADAFADAVNGNDWDTLLACSTGRSEAYRGSSMGRKSLYQQFDPLVRNSPIRQINKQAMIKEHGQMSEDLLNAEAAANNIHGNENLNLTFEICLSNEELHLEKQGCVADSEVQLENEEVNKIHSRVVETEAQLDDDEIKMLVEENMGTADTFADAMNTNDLDNFLAGSTGRPEAFLGTRMEKESLYDQFAPSAHHSPKQIKHQTELITMEHQQMKKEHEQLRKEHEQMKKEHGQMSKDLLNVEAAFNDVHGKYERVKVTLQNCSKNEELLLERDTYMQGRVADAEAQLEDIKTLVQEKMKTMYEDYESKYKALKIENGRLNAILRKSEMTTEKLENEVRQKSSEISKLNTLCDDLISQHTLK